MESEKHFQKRQNALTESDIEIIKAIVESVSYTRQNHHPDEHCKFTNINPEDMAEAVKFFKNVNSTIEDSKNTIRRTLLGILVLVVVGFMTEGFWSKILSKAKTVIGN